MAGIVAHLMIAQKIIEKLPLGTFKDEALFYAGSIAPDGVHARENYERAHKKKSHFRDDIRDIDFIKDENRAAFHNKARRFISDFLSDSNKHTDLYKGYLAHVLADELFIMTVREEFVKKMELSGIMQWDRAFFHKIVTELQNLDLQLIQNHSGINEIKNLLESTGGYLIDGYVTEDELDRSRKWVVNKFFNDEKPSDDYTDIAYDRMLEYIDEASEYVISYFKKHNLF